MTSLIKMALSFSLFTLDELSSDTKPAGNGVMGSHTKGSGVLGVRVSRAVSSG